MLKTTLSLMTAGLVLHSSACSSERSTDPIRLASALEEGLHGDRTGACVAAAIVDIEVQRAFACANPETARSLDGATAFEIGSLTKTMTGVLLADLVQQGTLELEDSLALHLPDGTLVPSYQGEPIRLKHLVTHTSGLPALPSQMSLENLDNPYAALTEADLLASLADVELSVAPGSHWDYSNFGFTLLSYVIARASGEEFEPLIRDRLFEPLGMDQAFIAHESPGVSVAQGHQSTGTPAVAWDIPGQFAGVGGVRASLEDMVRYVQAALGEGPAQTVSLIDRTFTPVPSQHGEPVMGLGWMMYPAGGRTIMVQDGGTGGFSSLLLLDRERGRAVVLLFDTQLTDLGGGIGLGLHLLDPNEWEMPAPRRLATPGEVLLQGLSGRYRIGEMIMRVRAEHGVMFLQAEGQPEFELGFDSYGDFFPRSFVALLTPVRLLDDTYSFRWTQGGASFTAERLP